MDQIQGFKSLRFLLVDSKVPRDTKALVAGVARKKAAELAEKFAEIIPAKTFAMATLQGYLMAYKIRPYDAVADAPAWVEKRLQEKAAKEVAKVAREEGGVSASS